MTLSLSARAAESTSVDLKDGTGASIGTAKLSEGKKGVEINDERRDPEPAFEKRPGLVQRIGLAHEGQHRSGGVRAERPAPAEDAAQIARLRVAGAGIDPAMSLRCRRHEIVSGFGDRPQQSAQGPGTL